MRSFSQAAPALVCRFFGTLLVVCFYAASSTTAPKYVRVFSVEKEAEGNMGQKSKGKNGTVSLNIDLHQSLTRISSHFIGVNLDAGLLKAHWVGFDFNSEKMQNMARALNPCFFRFGGTNADEIRYMFDGDNKSHEEMEDDVGGNKFGEVLYPLNMTAEDWTKLNEFVNAVGWDFVMDLNAVRRLPNGSWDSSNARQLLKFSQERGYKIAGFQLGNEYDYYKPTFNMTVSPDQLGQDVVTLKKLLSEFPQYSTSFIIGPEVVHNFRYYVSFFLLGGASNVVKAATMHQYYFFGGTAKLSYFTDVNIMDRLVGTLNDMFTATHAINPSMPVWLSETSSCYGGGAAGLSSEFVAGFLWLDKLGVSALKGVETVMRQSFYWSAYALLDANMNPNPDYWLTLLYKRLILGPVFNVNRSRKDVRVYSACANPNMGFTAGGLVVYILNPNNYTVAFDIPQLKSEWRIVYSLTAGDSAGLLSKFIALNGKKLELVDNKVPNLSGELMPPSPVETPPYSYTFLVFYEASVTLCQEM